MNGTSGQWKIGTAVTILRAIDVVILATLMFFASTANQPGNPWLRGALLAMAVLFCVAGAYRLLTSPRG